MIGELQALFDRRSQPFRQFGRMFRVEPQQQHRNRIVADAAGPVVLPEEPFDEDAQPLEQAIADAVAVLLVDAPR